MTCVLCHVTIPPAGRAFGRGEPQAVHEACLRLAVLHATDMDAERRLHDQVLHREPVRGCERCGVRR